jgi:hypothetical protein
MFRCAAAGLLLLAGLTAPLAAQTSAPPAAPVIAILAPTNGAAVRSPVTVRFRLSNYGVAPAGIAVDRTGHFHVLIDAEPGAAGTIIPTDSQHVHFGKGQIEAVLTLAPGRHVLRAVLGDAQHRVIGPELISAPITITVRGSR